VAKLTIDDWFPPGSRIRREWDEMIRETQIAISKYLSRNKTKPVKNKLMNLPPSEILKKKA
jgi:hypothetical protein